MWQDPELRELRIFLVLADELHFGRTAERLGISQPGVSEAVRVLESRLGIKVFDRTSRRVQLTPAGEKLKRSLVPPLAPLERAPAETRELSRAVRGLLPPRFALPPPGAAPPPPARCPWRIWRARSWPCFPRPPRRGSMPCSSPRARRQDAQSAAPSPCRPSTRSSRWWPAAASFTRPARPSPSSTATTSSSSPSTTCPPYHSGWSGAPAGKIRASVPSTKSPVQ